MTQDLKSVIYQFVERSIFGEYGKRNIHSTGIEVIGAGFGRTGTVSLKRALEILGYAPCYHARDIFCSPGHCQFWTRLSRGEKVNFEEIFSHHSYRASCDTPCSIFWREQLELYPDAKVILTVRDCESWYKSWSETIYTIMSDAPNVSFFCSVTLFILNMRPFQLEMKKRIFHNDYSKSNTIKCYNDHNANVIAECPKDKLLVFEVRRMDTIVYFSQQTNTRCSLSQT